MYYIFKQPLYISAMYHLGWIYGYEGCLICNVYCKISQKAFKSNRHYIPQSFLRGLIFMISIFESISEMLHGTLISVDRWCTERWPSQGIVETCNHDQIQLQKRKKKSQVARSGEYGGCGKTVTFSDFKKYFTNLGSCVGGLLWSIRTCLNTDTGCRLY